MSKIEWTTETWNPIIAYDRETGDRGWFCTRVSPGCKNCYAAKMNRQARWLGTGHDYTVPNLEEVRFELATGGQSGVFAPLRWNKPRRIFVCSMTDIFGEWVEDRWLRLLFSVMASAPDHTFQVLTKRPERMADFLSGLTWRVGMMRWPLEGRTALLHTFCFTEDEVEGGFDVEENRPGWVPPNIWLGTSVEDQKRAVERIPHLLRAPGAVRFLSCEPLLGPVDLEAVHQDAMDEAHGVPALDYLDWVIVGGESGPNARRCSLTWVQKLVNQCHDAGRAVFVKQLGSNPSSLPVHVARDGETLDDPKGGDPEEWPEQVRVREFPETALEQSS